MSDSAARRPGLGRGLGALITNTELNPASPEVIAQAEAGGVQLVAVELIGPNPHQPRTTFDATALDELAASITAHGIIQPLIVTADQAQTDRFWLVAGERRWRAAQQAGLRQVPVIVREASPQQLMEWALVENLQRADLNPLEEAAAYQALMDEYRLTQAEVAARVGKSRPAIANAVRLLQLPAAVQAAIIDQRISAGHARTLLALSSPAEMEASLAIIVSQGLNVRQTEELVKRRMAAADAPVLPSTPAPPAAEWQSLENRFRTALGTKVNLNRNADGTGKLVIHFYSDDDLDGLLRRMVESEEL